MWLFFGALVLNFMVFFREIEASGLRKVSTRPDVDDRDGIDHLVTSRRPTQSSSTYNNPTSLANEALDLNAYPPHCPESSDQQSHEYQCYPQESFHTLNSAEIPHLVSKYNFRNGRLPDLKSPIDHEKSEHSQENSKLENIEWLVDQTRLSEHKVFQQQLKDEEMRRLVHALSMRKNMIKQERPIKPRELRFREPIPSQNTGEASTMNPHATGEIGRRGKGKAASRKGGSDSCFEAEAAGRRNVLDSHDQIIQQSQPSEHDFQNFYPFSIPSRNSGFKPYIRFPPNDPNDSQHGNHPEGSASGQQK